MSKSLCHNSSLNSTTLMQKEYLAKPAQTDWAKLPEAAPNKNGPDNSELSKKMLYNAQAEHDACGVGFVGNISNRADHKIIEYATLAMSNLAHRGGQEEDPKMADGSGILTPIPLEFFQKVFPQIKDLKNWGLGFFFLPYDSFLSNALLECIRNVAEKFSFRIVTCREVPTDINIISRKVLATLPVFKQILFTAQDPEVTGENLEQHLYVLRKQIEFESLKILNKHKSDLNVFHISTLSSRNIVYKGILPGRNLIKFYPDLADESFKTPFAVFHERFSTNTKPSWHLTQPFRHIAHNGEINTIRGNISHMNTRETALSSQRLGDKLPYVLPAIHPSTSDSGAFDNVFELLLAGGYSLTEAISTMIPEPMGMHNNTNYYESKAPLMEPWDGPTTMVFTDGHSKVGASLDRNGLRPCRYSLTKDGVFILSSEVGVLEGEPGEYLEQGQLAPRSLIMVDFAQNKILYDEEIKEELFSKNTTKLNQIKIENAKGESEKAQAENAKFFSLFGFNDKSAEAIITTMVKTKEEPVGAMGLDEPLAVLSEKPQSLFNYFKQIFAQVTNPSIDPIREKFSMSLATYLGVDQNLFPGSKIEAPYFALPSPILDSSTLQQIESNPQIKSARVDITMPLDTSFKGFSDYLQKVCRLATKAVDSGAKILIISDKNMAKDQLPLPLLLALAAIDQELGAKKIRHLCDIVIESGQVFEVMHMALLFSFGAKAIYPYAALAAIGQYVEQGKIKSDSAEEATVNYYEAVTKGLLKVLARLGISTLSSFSGSSSFECIGLHHSVISKYFNNTSSSVGGIMLKDIYQENYERFLSYALGTRETLKSKHLWNQDICATLRQAAVENNDSFYRLYTKHLSQHVRNITLRSVWKFQKTKAININNVEDPASIRQRFLSAPMSLGALSQEAHECITLAFNRLGLASNCGEGGEDIERSKSKGTENDLCSRVRQIASGRFGVTAEYLAAGDEVQIKIAQGAKPGEGGQLPAHKVTPYIAKVRHTQEHIPLISPPPHHDIYSIEDLAQLIYDLKKLKEGLRVSVKLVAEAGIGTVAVGVVKAGADGISISGHDGGTGAAPLSSIYHTGLPWELGLAEVHQALVTNVMRHKVRLAADGQIQSGRDIVTAFMLGADEVAFGTSLLVCLGCTLCRQCHKGNCKAGICTQEEKLRTRFNGAPEHLENYLNFLAEDTRQHLAALGFSKVGDIIGRADLFQLDQKLLSAKAQKLDMSLLFQNLSYKPQKNAPVRPIEISPWEEEWSQKVAVALKKKEVLTHHQEVKNTDRAIGTKAAGLLALSYQDFPTDLIRLECTGFAGQSLAAFAPHGLSISLAGYANDYVAKGLSGGRVTVRPQGNLEPTSNLSLVGNVALYGATAGSVFIAGRAGERFAVRNSGARAVVEGVGDHGCEYMTGGVVIILGPCGHNFAAGLTGGVVYVYDKDESLAEKINRSTVTTLALEAADETELQKMLAEHQQETKSPKATEILADFTASIKHFKKVIPAS